MDLTIGDGAVRGYELPPPRTRIIIPPFGGMAINNIPRDSLHLPPLRTITAYGIKRRGRVHKRPICDIYTADQQFDLDGEIRLSKYRLTPPTGFERVWAMAHTQQFIVLSRTRHRMMMKRPRRRDLPYWEETVELIGTTGNIYTVQIGRLPRCDCTCMKKVLNCKHVVFVLSKVLRAPFQLIYQLSLLTYELQWLFENSPPIPEPDSRDDKKRHKIDGDCPICYEQLDPEDLEGLEWCRTGCGQNMHAACFDKWYEAKDGVMTCPMCRRVWNESDYVHNLLSQSVLNDDGYVNVGDALGLNENGDDDLDLEQANNDVDLVDIDNGRALSNRRVREFVLG